MLHFLSELAQLDRAELTQIAYQIFEICFSDEFLQKWVTLLMQRCCERVLLQPLTCNYTHLNYLGVII